MNCTSADGTSIAITRGRRVCQCDRAFEITVPPKGRSVLTGGCGYAAVRTGPQAPPRLGGHGRDTLKQRGG